MTVTEPVGNCTSDLNSALSDTVQTKGRTGSMQRTVAELTHIRGYFNGGLQVGRQAGRYRQADRQVRFQVDRKGHKSKVTLMNWHRNNVGWYIYEWLMRE